MLGRKLLGGISSVGLRKCDMSWIADKTVEETIDEWILEIISTADRVAAATFT
jgi:hypothetical protein